MGQIEIHFSAVMGLAKQLSDTAGQIKATEQEKLQQILCEAKAAYQSESADLLRKKEVKINAGILEEADRLQSISTDLEKRAKEMYLSESINQMMAKTRIY